MTETPLVGPAGIGTGNSPPTRKLAFWPLITVRFGSARMRTSPSCASASSVPATFSPWQATLSSSGTPATQGTAASPLAARFRAGSSAMLPMVPSADQLIPRLLLMLRAICTMRTCKVTWVELRTRIWLSTVCPAGT